MISDCRRNNYTSPQEHFTNPETFQKPSVDIEHEVDEVYKEEQMKQQMIVELMKLPIRIQGGENK